MISDLWYKNAVIYCLSVGTYMDANGDGIGDFTGLMRRLDYVQGLGATAIWLLPFQISPGRDDGYDEIRYVQLPNPRPPSVEGHIFADNTGPLAEAIASWLAQRGL